MDEEKIRHMNAFYALLKKWIRGKEYSSVLMTKEDYDARRLPRRLFDRECQCIQVVKRYHVFKYADDSAALVLCPSPKKNGAVDVTAMPLNSLQQLTYMERLFIDLWKIHQADHCKGVMFYYRFGQAWQRDKGSLQAIHGCMPPLYCC